MYWGIYTIIALVLLTSSLSAMKPSSPFCGMVGLIKPYHKSNKNSIVDPVLFGCIYDDGMTEFDVVKNDNKAEMYLLSEKLNNGRDLSLFFLGTGNTITEKCERFKNAKEWYTKSRTNVCYIAYAFGDQKATLYNLYFYLKKIIKTNRVEYVARETLDLILNVRQKCMETQTEGCLRNMSQLVMVGYSLGAHIGAFTCRYLYEQTGQKIKKLIGLDPAGISHLFDRENYIKKGDADYVQVIHSSVMGTQMPLGDTDIYIKSDLYHPYKNHKLAVKANDIVSTKKAILIASKRGNGRVVDIQEGKTLDPDLIKIGEDECLVGVYNNVRHREEENEGQEEKSYKISLGNRLVKSLSF